MIIIAVLSYQNSNIIWQLSEQREDIFQLKMKQYPLPEFYHLKMKLDQFQINYECCGSYSYQSWYSIDLYQFPYDINQSDEEFRAYLMEKFRCHYGIMSYDDGIII